MLGKYWSICLIAGLGIAALVDSRRSAYFRSPAPWVSGAVGTVLLAPHVLWLFTHDFGPVGYAALRHKESLSPVLVSALVFLAGFAGYIAPAVLGALLAARPTLQALRDMVFPTSPQRRLVNVAFFAPVLLAITAAIVLRVEIADVWMIPAATLLPIVLLSSALVMMRRKAVVWLLAIAIPFPVVMVVAAPGIAMVIHRMGLERHHADHYRLLAQALERSWREATDASLRLVGGDFDLVSGALFYLRDRASAYFIIYPSLSPWVDETRIEDEGIALVCPTDEPMCVSALSARSMRTGVRPTEITLVREYLGVPGPPTRYVIAVIPPNFGKR
jgi:hypothetical protein